MVNYLSLIGKNVEVKTIVNTKVMIGHLIEV